MKTRLWWLTLVVAVVLSSSAAWADSEFYVIAGGGAVGTKITILPYTIDQAGFYYLGGNLATNGDGITVAADNVTIDLMGFNLTRSSSPGGNGIHMSGRANVEIRNGTLRNFENGINEDWSSGNNHRIINVRALNNSNCGIRLYGTNHLVKGCNGSKDNYGIYLQYGTAIDNVACDNTTYGLLLLGGSVIGNVANNNGSQGFYLGNSILLVERNYASGNATNYYGGGANTAWGVNAGK